MKITKYSGIPSKKHSKINSKTKKKCYDYYDDIYDNLMYESSYEYLFKALNQCGIEEDYELTHSIEDDILHKFLIEIMNNKYKTKKEIITIARMIYDNTLKKKNTKWYA